MCRIRARLCLPVNPSCCCHHASKLQAALPVRRAGRAPAGGGDDRPHHTGKLLLLLGLLGQWLLYHELCECSRLRFQLVQMAAVP